MYVAVGYAEPQERQRLSIVLSQANGAELAPGPVSPRTARWEPSLHLTIGR